MTDLIAEIRKAAYTESETNEMVGKMIRDQYKSEQEADFMTWICSHNQVTQTSYYHFTNGLKLNVDHNLKRAYLVNDENKTINVISTVDMKLDTWMEVLIGIEKL